MRLNGLFRGIAALAVAAGIALSAQSASAAPRFPISDAVTTFALDNGLEVVVIPDHRSPTVTHMVWYKVGAADDPPGKSGIAHFLEHLMFKGTAAHPAGEFSLKVAEIGGDENAFTTSDMTVFHQNVAKEHLGLMMEYEADRMEGLVLSDEAVTPERQVIIEERRSRVDNSPGSRLSEAVGSALWQNGHYGIPVIGWEHEMEGLTRADAIAFYDRYYTPNNAILIVAGDVDENEVRTLAEATYGKLPRRSDPPPRIRPSEPEAEAARVVTLTDPRVTQPSVQRQFVTPSYGTAKPGEAEALDVLAQILGGGTTSRLYKGLVLGKGVATSAGAGYGGTALGETGFGLYGSPRGDVTPEALVADIQGVVDDLAKNGVSDEELARAKRTLIASAVYSQDSHSELANVFGQALIAGQSVAAVQHWPDAIEAVTTADVQAAARRYLAVPRSVTGYLMPTSGENRS